MNGDYRRDVLLEEWRQNLRFMRFEREEYWKRFHVFLIVNSALLAFVGAMLGFGNSEIQLWPFFLALSCISFTINIAWLFANFRSHAYYKHWVQQALKLERDENLGVLNTITELNRYYRTMKMRSFYKTLPITIGTQIIPIIFASFFTFVYFILFGQWYFEVALVFDVIVLYIFIVLGILKASSVYGQTERA